MKNYSLKKKNKIPIFLYLAITEYQIITHHALCRINRIRHAWHRKFIANTFSHGNQTDRRRKRQNF